MEKHLLEAKLKEKKINIEILSTRIGMQKTTFYRKLNGKSDFFRNEIEKIVDALELTIEEMEKIFFSDIVT